jgi:hypothetical protein
VGSLHPIKGQCQDPLVPVQTKVTRNSTLNDFRKKTFVMTCKINFECYAETAQGDGSKSMSATAEGDTSGPLFQTPQSAVPRQSRTAQSTPGGLQLLLAQAGAGRGRGNHLTVFSILGRKHSL